MRTRPSLLGVETRTIKKVCFHNFCVIQLIYSIGTQFYNIEWGLFIGAVCYFHLLNLFMWILLISIDRLTSDLNLPNLWDGTTGCWSKNLCTQLDGIMIAGCSLMSSLCDLVNINIQNICWKKKPRTCLQVTCLFLILWVETEIERKRSCIRDWTRLLQYYLQHPCIYEQCSCLQKQSNTLQYYPVET